jgi:hypothetical protein
VVAPDRSDDKRDPCTRCSPFELNPCLEEDPSYQNLEESRHHGLSQSPQTPGVCSPGRATPSPLLQNGQGDASRADVAKGPYRRLRCGLKTGSYLQPGTPDGP